MPSPISRRRFVANAAGIAAVVGARPAWAARARQPMFTISLAEWSLHRELWDGTLDHLDFAKTAREAFDIDAVEYVNTFFKDKANDRDYLTQMRTRAADHGVKSLLIMCDAEGRIGDPDGEARRQTVDNHRKWLDAAAFLGCHSIRVNAASEGTYEEQQKFAADGLAQLTAAAAPMNLNVIVENHGGLSSNGQWLSGVIKLVNDPRCGTLPDFGNFCFDWDKKDDPTQWYDRYKGVSEMMPFAKAVSAKSFDFDEAGNETTIDYPRMMKIVVDAGYHAHLGIEYEGDRLPEREGVARTKALLLRIREQMS